ncbi:Auxilin-related protein [Actinidia chinensis var. chinensis]|uniref:Auxilin-related protein n=1 Tax=Actinidia chinensis var. chinensis TaxID=1590841 RepID=A0A2R6R3T0_ACTCC|nr:Auxilin-related protein [Actinidia chinensis var. chinensis]
MDEFGVLVESIGFKAQGRSAPMSDLKSQTKFSNGGSNFGINSGFDAKPTSGNRPKSAYNSNSRNGSFDVDLDGFFRSGNDRKATNSGDFDGFDDVFGGPIMASKPSGGDGFDFDSVLTGSSNISNNGDDDVFGVFKSSTKVHNDDVFGSMGSFSNPSAPVGDLLGNFGGLGFGSNGLKKKSGKVEKNDSGFDDLIPGFGGRSPSRNGENAETSWSPQSSVHSAKSTSNLAEDPFVVLEQSSSQAYTTSGLFSEPVKQHSGKRSVLSSFDDLDGFAMGKARDKANEQSSYNQKGRPATATHDLDSFFSMGIKSSSTLRKSTTVDPVYDSLFQSRGNPGAEQTPPRRSSNTKKASPTTNIGDDFSFLFGAAPSASSGVFQEIEGESEERRRARLNHHMRTQQRMAKALAEKNQRDFQTQQDQEERHRIAETLDNNIKRWAAGKEGNLRALLSSLQSVLWPECGWHPVSLTDLITSISVKKVYHKATLCVHPDKVQQKGANIEQKYIAEKVFDLLKEAWNKFNAEEL